MTTITDLTATLTAALGLSRRLVDETARHLQDAEMLPDDPAASATPEDAVTLLLGLMTAPTPKDAPDCARLYAQLPLSKINHGAIAVDGTYQFIRLAEDIPFAANVASMGDTFGEFFATVLRLYMKAPALGRFVGLNVYPIEAGRSRAWNVRRMKREIEDTRRQRKYMLRDRNLSKESRRSVIEQYNAYIADQQNEMRAYMKRSRVHPNLR